MRYAIKSCWDFLDVGSVKFSISFAESLCLSRNSNSKPTNEQAGRLLTFILMQCFVHTVSGNGLTLKWYMELMLFQPTTRHILRRILEKRLKAYILLHYLHYMKSLLQKNLVQTLQSNLL